MIIDEGLFIRNHVWMIYTCQDAYFIYCIFFVFIAHRAYLRLFQSVDLVVCHSFHFVNAAIGPIAEFTQNCKVFQYSAFRFFDNSRLS